MGVCPLSQALNMLETKLKFSVIFEVFLKTLNRGVSSIESNNLNVKVYRYEIARLYGSLNEHYLINWRQVLEQTLKIY